MRHPAAMILMLVLLAGCFGMTADRSEPEPAPDARHAEPEEPLATSDSSPDTQTERSPHSESGETGGGEAGQSFFNGIPDFDGTPRLELDINGEKMDAEFQIAEPQVLIPFGFYVPEIVERKRLEDGVEWWFKNKWIHYFAILEYDDFYFSEPGLVRREELAAYKEYEGSYVDEEAGRNQDLFVVEKNGKKYILFWYIFEDEREEVLPLFTAIVRELRYVPEEEAIKRGWIVP